MCTPALSAFCGMIDAAVQAAPAATAEFVFTAQEVSIVAENARVAGEPLLTEHQLYVEGKRAIANQTTAFGSTSFSFDTSGNLKISEAAGIREWTLLDTNVRLEASIQSCVELTATPTVEWSWSKVVNGSDPVWTTIDGQSRLRMKVGIDTLDGEADYVFRCNIVGEDTFVDFDVIINGIPPPVADIAAPETASPSCTAVLDASGSYDPSGASLSFAWQCIASSNTSQAKCDTLVSGVTSSRLDITGGTLDAGLYTFYVQASRTDAAASTSATLLLTNSLGVPPPSVSMARPPQEVSPQLELEFSALIISSGECQAPPWEAWWILPTQPNGDPIEANATLLTRTQDGTGALVVPAPLPVQPGQYLLRLTLASSSLATATEGTNSFFAFDSFPFLVDEPPSDGRCQIFPEEGNVSTTSFRLLSLDWVDDDLPLEHRFFWRQGDLLTANGTWKVLRSWGMGDTFENVLFGQIGTVSGRAEARDTLGSVSLAFSEATVVMPPEPPGEDLLANALSSVAAGGEPFATLAAITAVADTSSSGAGASKEFANTMLDTMSGSGALEDATPEAVGATANALNSILGSSLANAEATASDSGGAPTPAAVDPEVASKAAAFVGSIASAAGTLEDGLDTDTATTLFGSVDTLFLSVAVSPTPSPAANAGSLVAGESSEEEQAANLAAAQALSTQLQSATSAIGEAVLKGAAVGEPVSITSGGLSMSLVKETAASMASESKAIGDVIFPPMPGLASSARRRLEECADSGIGLQNTKWPSNPFAYKGPNSTANLSIPQGWAGSCCSVDQEVVQSIDIKACGEILEVRDLQENITFVIPAARIASDTSTFEELRLCQYFDLNKQAWSTEGCIVAEATDTNVTCSCNHLSAFTVAFGTISAIIEEAVLSVVVCANVNVLSPGGLERMFTTGAWVFTRAGIVMWVVIILFIGLTVYAFRAAEKPKHFELGTSREAVLIRIYQHHHSAEAKEAKLVAVADSWTRMREAAEAKGRSRLTALVVWQMKKFVLGPQAKVEEHLVDSVIQSFFVLMTLAGMQQMAVAKLGIDRKDARILFRQNQRSLEDVSSDSAVNPVTTKLFESLTSLTDTVAGEVEKYSEDIVGEQPRARQLVQTFKAFHPVARATKQSVSMWRGIMVLAMALNVFGSLAVTALFLQSSSIDLAVSTPEYCAEQGFWVNLIRDIGYALLSSLVAAGPTFSLLFLHRRPIKYFEDEQMQKKSLRIRLGLDYILVLVAVAWVCLCALLSLSFVANVRASDGDHWIVSALVFFLRQWLIMPFAIAFTWEQLATRVSGKPELRQKVQLLHGMTPMLQSAASRRKALRSVASMPETLDFHSWARQWLKQSEKPKRREAKARQGAKKDEFASWAQEWLSQNPAGAAMRDARTADGQAPPPPPSAAPEKVALGPSERMCLEPRHPLPSLPARGPEFSPTPAPPHIPEQAMRQTQSRGQSREGGAKKKPLPPPPPPPLPQLPTPGLGGSSALPAHAAGASQPVRVPLGAPAVPGSAADVQQVVARRAAPVLAPLGARDGGSAHSVRLPPLPPPAPSSATAQLQPLRQSAKSSSQPPPPPPLPKRPLTGTTPQVRVPLQASALPPPPPQQQARPSTGTSPQVRLPPPPPPQLPAPEQHTAQRTVLPPPPPSSSSSSRPKPNRNNSKPSGRPALPPPPPLPGVPG